MNHKQPLNQGILVAYPFMLGVIKQCVLNRNLDEQGVVLDTKDPDVIQTIIDNIYVFQMFFFVPRCIESKLPYGRLINYDMTPGQLQNMMINASDELEVIKNKAQERKVFDILLLAQKQKTLNSKSVKIVYDEAAGEDLQEFTIERKGEVIATFNSRSSSNQVHQLVDAVQMLNKLKNKLKDYPEINYMVVHNVGIIDVAVSCHGESLLQSSVDFEQDLARLLDNYQDLCERDEWINQALAGLDAEISYSIGIDHYSLYINGYGKEFKKEHDPIRNLKSTVNRFKLCLEKEKKAIPA